MLFEALIMFMVYSIIGWIWETSFISIRYKRYINRGFLRGPVVPIYGIGATTIMLSMMVLEPYLTVSSPANVLLSMLYIAAVATALEYVTSYVMEIAFSTRWWDYTERRCNLHGRIALAPTLFWGIGGYILWQYINTPIIHAVKKLDETTLHGVLWFFYVLITVDAIITIIDLINLSHILKRLHESSTELVDQLAKQRGRMEESFFNLLSEVKEEIKNTAPYQKLNGLMGMNEIILAIRNRVSNLSEGPERALERFSDSFSKMKRFRRFFLKYPNATTRKLPVVFSFLRRKK